MVIVVPSDIERLHDMHDERLLDPGQNLPERVLEAELLHDALNSSRLGHPVVCEDEKVLTGPSGTHLGDLETDLVPERNENFPMGMGRQLPLAADFRFELRQ